MNIYNETVQVNVSLFLIYRNNFFLFTLQVYGK